MAYPLPITTCERCGVRFVLEPDALLDEEASGEVEILCAECLRKAAWGGGFVVEE